jgi:hypothetical protein
MAIVFLLFTLIKEVACLDIAEGGGGLWCWGLCRRRCLGRFERELARPDARKRVGPLWFCRWWLARSLLFLLVFLWCGSFLLLLLRRWWWWRPRWPDRLRLRRRHFPRLSQCLFAISRHPAVSGRVVFVVICLYLSFTQLSCVLSLCVVHVWWWWFLLSAFSLCPLCLWLSFFPLRFLGVTCARSYR